ncbi:DUF418 domain-containing protein [Deinococcus yavapaiensis]|uniref:DUF418 domain-containing protein n=1 Tax=Deinococcus yavapaiensis KR-236 TaxID=694435 RepID=A0A318S795_9DEIO|nr:DUF418 domain-containing protein [Deinococcus yavapaiensis]PYE53577.1 uncharacterized protein DES52_108106 [Deinococcus yavapaiensis KR-236]
MTAPERALLPDALRGLALGGILLVNLQNFSGLVPWQQTGGDRVAQAFVDFFANGKWISTFAMLFGAGVWLLVRRAGRGREARRLLGLFGLGLAHGFLIWSGDILANYALVGFALLSLIRLPPAVQGVVAVLGFLLGAALFASLTLISGSPQADPSSVGVNFAFASPDITVVSAARIADFNTSLSSSVPFFAPWLLGLFLLGVLFARSGVLTHPDRFRRPLIVTALVTFPLGVLLNVALVRANASDLFKDQVWAVLLRLSGGLTFALLYGALLALLVAGGRGALLRLFANVGRLALSNYLLQSIVCTLVFYGYGWGQYGRWGATACLAFGLGLYAVQIALSALCLTRFDRGPAESLLRGFYRSRPVKDAP